MWNVWVSVFIRSFVVVKTAQPEHYWFVWPVSVLSPFNFILYVYSTRFLPLSSNLKNLKTHSKCHKKSTNKHTIQQQQQQVHIRILWKSFFRLKIVVALKNCHHQELHTCHAMLSHCHICDTKHNNPILHVDCWAMCDLRSKSLHSAF